MGSGDVDPLLSVDSTPWPSEPPGAEISTDAPKLLYDARWPARPIAPTVMTPLQLAGDVWLASALLFPAATTTTAFAASAVVDRILRCRIAAAILAIRVAR